MKARLDPRAIDVVDAVARQLIARAVPIRLGLASTPIERELCFRLRYTVASERGWFGRGAAPNGVERDAWDDEAAHVAAWDGSELIGTARLVFPRAGLALPAEEAFGIAIEGGSEIVDISRLAVARSRSEPGHRAFGALIGGAWQEARRSGYARFIGVFTPAAVRLYRRMGLELQPLAPARLHWGELRQACLIAPMASVFRLEERWLGQPNLGPDGA